MATVGLLHPGEMGAAVGGCLVSVGHEVLWDPAGRSRASTGRALAAELTGVAFDRLIARSSVILSVCPPHAALDVARQVAVRRVRRALRRRQRDLGRDRRAGLAPSSPRPARPTWTAASSACRPRWPGTPGCTCPARRPTEVRTLFSRSRLDARIAEGPLYAASSVKMAYAAWTKGSAALLLAARALARASGVERTLLAEWSLSQQALGEQSERSAAAAAAKGWRWVAEMEEIAASMAAAGPAGRLPRGRRRHLRPRRARRGAGHAPPGGARAAVDARHGHVRPDVARSAGRATPPRRVALAQAEGRAHRVLARGQQRQPHRRARDPARARAGRP